jgi:hypothetical protein
MSAGGPYLCVIGILESKGRAGSKPFDHEEKVLAFLNIQHLICKDLES